MSAGGCVVGRCRVVAAAQIQLIVARSAAAASATTTTATPSARIEILILTRIPVAIHWIVGAGAATRREVTASIRSRATGTGSIA